MNGQPSSFRALSIAPMMDRTDRHFRFILRQITRETLLYTEMINAKAILFGPRDQLLGFEAIEHPIACQLGGDSPSELAEAAKIAEGYGYDEININVGCPSDRVQSGSFGACLMKVPERVAEMVVAMAAAVSVPVTVKHRIGVDDLDRYEDMLNFVRVVSQAPSARFTVHARKAWLQGLSPKQNRNIPPLRYADVHRLKQEMPEQTIEINGGIRTMEQAAEQLQLVDAVMIGRAAVDDPMVFADADALLGGEAVEVDRREVVRAVVEYARRWEGTPRHKLHHISRHLLQLYSGQPGARRWRREVAERTKGEVSADVLLEALACMR